jgi:NACalpha-BTF3-like transcription factor
VQIEAPVKIQEEEDEEGGDVDDEGVEPKDIELVMTQVRVCTLATFALHGPIFYPFLTSKLHVTTRSL